MSNSTSSSNWLKFYALTSGTGLSDANKGKDFDSGLNELTTTGIIFDSDKRNDVTNYTQFASGATELH